MKGKLKDLTFNGDGSQNITVTVEGDCRELFDSLNGKRVSVEIKADHPKRSLDANAYCWVLIDKIAEKTGVRKTDVYRHAIKEIGGVSDTVCTINRAVDRLRTGWEKNGMGWQTDVMPSKVEGCTNVVLYYGSSVYDSKQMSDLIDSLIQDAEALGIPTITDKEAEKMIGKWAVRNDKECAAT